MKKTAIAAFSLLLAFILVFAMAAPASAASLNQAEKKAEALKQLGLFKGVSDTDFALDRAPTRIEALVMLIRTLGKEEQAQNGDFSHPFIDVPAWADKYVGYGYEKGLTKGTSAAEFGSGNADADMYLTFMLRALGYSDTEGDFKWSAPDTLAGAAGILPEGVNTEGFLRADAALISWAALEAGMKSGIRTLSEKLIEEKAFTAEAYAAALAIAGETKPETVTVSSLGELLSALSNDSVKAVVISSAGTPVVIKGEVSIPAGVTVTLSRGSDLYIEGSLTNKGRINVMGADSVMPNFINYSVLSVQTGGRLINSGAIELESAILSDTDDYGPIGGQLRISGGAFTNNGSVLLEYAPVNTHGGMAVVISGTWENSGHVIIDGFFLRVGNGSFINNAGAVVINNTHIFAGGESEFINNGTLTGQAVEKES